MAFGGWTWWTALGVLGGATAVLALLHLLRVRAPQRNVITLLFWPDLPPTPRARVLGGRFRNLPTFLLLTAVLVLASFALTGPLWRSTPTAPVVVVVDAGFSMSARTAAGQTRWQAARDAAERYVAGLGARQPVAVVVAGALPRATLGFDEARVTLPARLGAVTPGDEPAAVEPALQLAATWLGARPDGHIVWFTDRAAVPAGLKAALRIERRVAGETAPNAALLTALFEPDPTNPMRGRVRVRVGWWGAPPANLEVHARLATGADVVAAPMDAKPGDTRDFLLTDAVPADGSVLTLELRGDTGVPSDDRLSVRLPQRSALRFVVAPDVPAPLRAALAALGEVKPSGAAAPDAADVIPVGTDCTQLCAARRALIVTGTGNPDVRGQTVTSASGPALDFEDALCGDGGGLPACADHPLLRAGNVVVAATDAMGERCHLWLSPAVCGATSEVPRRAAWLVFLAHQLGQLAGWDAGPVVLPPVRMLVDPCWTPADDATQVTAAPGDRNASDLRVAPPQAEAPGPTAGSAARTATAGAAWGFEPFEWMLLGLVAALAIEAVLHARGKVV